MSPQNRPKPQSKCDCGTRSIGSLEITDYQGYTRDVHVVPVHPGDPGDPGAEEWRTPGAGWERYGNGIVLSDVCSLCFGLKLAPQKRTYSELESAKPCNMQTSWHTKSADMCSYMIFEQRIAYWLLPAVRGNSCRH